MRDLKGLAKLGAGVILLLLGTGVLRAQSVKRGDVFPAFTGQDIVTGRTISLEKLRGKVVLVDFWATWCGPCRGEVPNVLKVYERFHAQGFEIISISLDRNVDVLKSYIKSQKMEWNHIFDKDGKLRDKYGVRGIPQMYVIGRDGKVLSESARGPELARVVEQGLKEKAPIQADERAEGAAADLDRADKLAAAGKADQALQLYDEIAAKHKDDEPGKVAAERARKLREDPDVAQKLAEAKRANLEKEATRGGTPWLSAARQMAREGKYDLARKYYQRIIDKYAGTMMAKTADDEMKKLPA